MAYVERPCHSPQSTAINVKGGQGNAKMVRVLAEANATWLPAHAQ